MRTPRRARPTALSLDECRIRASLLLKDIRSDDPVRAACAAERLRVLPYFAPSEPDAILARRGAIRLKHALAAVAAELGYATWADCKARLQAPAAGRVDTERFFAGGASYGYLNRWFTRYDEARASLEAEGGYLFPYRHQFFVCETGFVAALGVDPDDPDWDRIGRDWVRPRDEAARDRLERRLVALGFGGRDEGKS
jgi:hypothetical protein